MRVTKQIGLIIVAGAVVLSAKYTFGQTREARIVESAQVILDEIMSIPARNIPESMLADAQAVAIIPNVVKGSFVVGIRHGRGVVVTRAADGSWQAPTFITLTGGSVGWQVGVQATDVILVFKTRNSIDGLMRGKFTIGADAAAAAGPLGRQASAATDTQLKAEILSYSRSRGLFAGVSLDGSAIQIDTFSNQVYYGSPFVAQAERISAQPVSIPLSAVQLIQQIAKYTRTTQATLATDDIVSREGSEPADGKPTGGSDELRTELATASLHLYAVLDEAWQRYLALPAEVFRGSRPPTAATLQSTLSRFDVVAAEPRYLALATRQEFQRTHALLKQYLDSQTWRDATFSLPPPPRSDGRTSG